MPHAPTDLRCEYRCTPLGLDVRRPRLSWKLVDNRRGAAQKAYHVRVASSPEALAGRGEADLWDTGRVASDRSVHVVYDGPRLKSRQRVWWQVRVWDQAGKASPWSEPAWWEMGLVRPKDWKAAWIASPEPGDPAESTPCPLLRRRFKVGPGLARARLYVTALGVYEMWLNGKRVGDRLLTPGWTDFRSRVQVQTYDVTDLLKKGPNALGAILGDGWWSGPLSRRHKKHPPLGGEAPALRAQLELVFEDGKRKRVGTDHRWRVWTNGPVRASDLYDGETYDARREIARWAEAGYSHARWGKAVVVEPAPRALTASAAPPVRRIETLKPVSVTQYGKKRAIVDFGQNRVGWVRLAVPEKTRRGKTVTLHFAEVLDEDGSLYTENLRKAACTDRFIAGGGKAVWEPRFTTHGFRYVEVTGYPGEVDAKAVTAVVVHADMPPTGTFACSDDRLNQLQHNILWSQKGNFLDVPTDCPQRDERLGWTGDIQIFVRTACFNLDVAGFLTKWMTDLADCQTEAGSFPSIAPVVDDKPGTDGGPGWADAAVVVPWTLYLAYGDVRVLRRHYKMMKRYAAFVEKTDPFARHNFSDWLHHQAPTPPDLVATAYHARVLDLMSRIAAVLGKQTDADRFARAFRRVARAFRRRYVTRDGRLAGDTQTAYVLALRFDLLPDDLRPRAAEHLARDILEGRQGNMYRRRGGHLSTGFLGVKHLLFALADAGRLDLAHRLLLTTDYPSWLFPVTHGATTIWERWDGWTPDGGFRDPGMNSFNHYAYGAVGEWLYHALAGLDTDPARPGYKHLVIRPRPLRGGEITHAEATLETVYGRAASAWRLDGDDLVLEVTVPPNASATVHVPATSARQVTEGGKPISKVKDVKAVKRGAAPAASEDDAGAVAAEGTATFAVGAGTYQFRSAGWAAE